MALVSAIMTATENYQAVSWKAGEPCLAPGFFAFMDRNRRQGTATTQILEMLSSRGHSVSVCMED